MKNKHIVIYNKTEQIDNLIGYFSLYHHTSGQEV